MTFKRNLRYRMPVGFGPSPGPRQNPEGTRYNNATSRRHVTAVSFLTQASALEALLPPGFSLDGEPVVTVELVRLTALEWLAGRGYSLLGVKFPVRYAGATEQARGPFLSVLWENLADPIITGREELGFAKLYCELPPTRTLNGREISDACWLGHTFARIAAWDLADGIPKAAQSGPIDGVLHYKYVPKTGSPGVADVEHAVLSPSNPSASKMESLKVGQGRVEFIQSTWEQLPTMSHIINILAALPQLEERGSVVSQTRGGSDLTEQRPLS